MVELRNDDRAAPSLTLVAGLALIETVDSAAPKAPVRLKWPNDLLMDGAKLAGILLERSGNRVAVGFGVNLAAAPAIEGRQTAALKPLVDLEPEEFAPMLANSFARVLAAWRKSEPAQFAQAWMARAHEVGTPLQVHIGAEERVAGTFDGIEPDGAMRLKRDGMIDIIRAGDVKLA